MSGLLRQETFVVAAPPSRGPARSGEPEAPRSPIRGRATWVESRTPPAAPGGQGRPWVLILHGFKGFLDWGFFPLLARRIAEGGMVSIAFNTSGSGIGPDLESFTELEAFAHASISRQLQDVRHVADLARDGALGLPLELDPERAGIFGHSRGGGAALVHAAERGDYRAVATWAALDSFDRWDGPTKDLWRRLGQLPVSNARTGQEMPIDVSVLEDFEANADRFDVLAACSRLEAPVLAVHGSEDETVPPSALDRIHAALPPGANERLDIPGTGHTFGAVHPLTDAPPALERALAATVSWFQRQLLEPGGQNSDGQAVTRPGAGRT